MAKIAFIGLGRMGSPMAANLVKSQHKVTAFDLVQEAKDQAAKDGAEIAASGIAAVKDAEYVITMLPVGEHVHKVWSEILPHVPDGCVMIDCSTIDVATSLKTHEMAKARKLACLDAPVSGGVPGAAAATLTFMVGGDAATFAKCKPVLEAMGRKIVHCGKPGSGQGVKICNNMVAAVAMIGASEAFTLGEKLGLSKEALFEVASTSSGLSWAVTPYNPVPGLTPTSPANNDYKAGFSANLMLKDLGLAADAARTSGAATPLGTEAMHLLRLYVQLGHGEKDFSGVINLINGKVKT
jgi:3-hydroxyisobutyrate dehydrogenase